MRIQRDVGCHQRVHHQRTHVAAASSCRPRGQAVCHRTTIEEIRFREHLESHKTEIANTHAKIRTCVWCDYSNLKYPAFYAHMRTKHNNEKKKCPLTDCIFSTSVEEDLQEHLFKIHGATYDEMNHSIRLN